MKYESIMEKYYVISKVHKIHKVLCNLFFSSHSVVLIQIEMSL